jgi:hypothetical protein
VTAGRCGHRGRRAEARARTSWKSGSSDGTDTAGAHLLTIRRHAGLPCRSFQGRGAPGPRIFNGSGVAAPMVKV